MGAVETSRGVNAQIVAPIFQLSMGVALECTAQCGMHRARNLPHTSNESPSPSREVWPRAQAPPWARSRRNFTRNEQDPQHRSHSTRRWGAGTGRGAPGCHKGFSQTSNRRASLQQQLHGGTQPDPAPPHHHA